MIKYAYKSEISNYSTFLLSVLPNYQNAKFRLVEFQSY